MKLIWGSSFRRAFKKIVKSDPALKDKVAQSLELLLKDPFNPSLKTHKLSGRLKEFWAFIIEYDCRIVFQFVNHDILLIDIGKHDEVY